MNIAALCGALVPVFFVLLLGYLAGKAHSFNGDQASGLSKLALGFALPASLFVGMAALPRDLLVAQVKLALCLLGVHLGLLLLAHFVLHKLCHVQTTRSLVFSLMLSTSATPVFGVAVLSPLLGSTAIGAVGLVALAINFAVPVAVILFEIDAAGKIAHAGETAQGKASANPPRNPAIDGLKAGLSSPLLWAPILGCALAMSGKHMPTIVSSSFTFIGSATSGVAVFAVGLILAAHRMMFSRAVLLGTLGRVSIQSMFLFGLAMLLHITGPVYREAIVCCGFPPATTVTLLAAKYQSSEAESASVLLFSTLLLAATIPTLLYLTR
jgi:malonate transporter and related proteins